VRRQLRIDLTGAGVGVQALLSDLEGMGLEGLVELVFQAQLEEWAKLGAQEVVRRLESQVLWRERGLP
jgi:hypothetical protein